MLDSEIYQYKKNRFRKNLVFLLLIVLHLILDYHFVIVMWWLKNKLKNQSNKCTLQQHMDLVFPLRQSQGSSALRTSCISGCVSTVRYNVCWKGVSRHITTKSSENCEQQEIHKFINMPFKMMRQLHGILDFIKRNLIQRNGMFYCFKFTKYSK